MAAADHLSTSQVSHVIGESDLDAWFQDYHATNPLLKAVQNNRVDAPTLYRGVYRYSGMATNDDVRDRLLTKGSVSLGPSYSASRDDGLGFSSWTEDSLMARKFADQGDEGTVYAVNGLQGFPLHHYVDSAAHPRAASEREWLVPEEETSAIDFKHVVRPRSDLQVFFGRPKRV